MARAAAVAALLGGLAACGDDGAPAPPQPVCGQAMAVSNPGLAFRPRAQCGPTLDFTPINAYTGEFVHAQDVEGAVAIIGGDCTGTLIAAAAGPVMLTAGHCLPDGGTALVSFNVETDADGDTLTTTGSVIERGDAPDYALLALDQLPQVTPTVLTRTPSDRLAIIQHPRGMPKAIALGDYLAECTGIVSYTDLDTLGGSSGAGVLTMTGGLLAVHTDGDCTTDGGGVNYGWSAAAIVAASTYLVDADLTDL